VFDLARELADLARDVRLEPTVAAGKLRELGQILRPRAKALPLLEAPADVVETLEDLLRALAILPEVGLGGLCL
jgi:hypothetical protein